MLLPGPLADGVLLRRTRRFLADVRLDDGRVVTAHCPNPGSMRSCATPGVAVRLSPAPAGARRKLAWTWEVARTFSADVLVHPARLNALVREAAERGAIGELSGYRDVRPEPRSAGGRFDLALEAPGRARCLVEIKSATLLVAPGEVAFPDAVTCRGLRHLDELAEAARSGQRAVLLLVSPRADARRVRPAWEIDPAWSARVAEVAREGVEVLALRAVVEDRRVCLDAALTVDLAPPPTAPPPRRGPRAGRAATRGRSPAGPAAPRG